MAQHDDRNTDDHRIVHRGEGQMGRRDDSHQQPERQGAQSSQSADERGDDEASNRYQGGAGGYRSNAAPYAASQTYGGDGDQLGYGSAPASDDSNRHYHPEDAP